MLEILVTFLIFCFRRIRGLWYLARGPEIIDRAYIAAEGKPFRIYTPSNDHLLVTSKEHIAELVNAPLQNLSLHAVAKEILQPKYTMFGFEWHNQRGVEGTGFVRALRSRLTAHLPILMPELQRIVETAIADELVAPGSDGKWGSPQLCLIPSDCSRLRALQTVPYDQANGHQGQLLRLLRGGTCAESRVHRGCLGIPAEGYPSRRDFANHSEFPPTVRCKPSDATALRR